MPGRKVDKIVLLHAPKAYEVPKLPPGWFMYLEDLKPDPDIIRQHNALDYCCREKIMRGAGDSYIQAAMWTDLFMFVPCVMEATKLTWDQLMKCYVAVLAHQRENGVNYLEGVEE